MQPSFLSYTPVALAFGTSGLRGLVKDLTDLEALINVKGTLRWLLATGQLKDGVVLAGDLRPSTARIMAAALQAALDLGLRVEHAGRVPSPALFLRSVSTGRAGVMVTGSHIPFDRNGIKINKPSGELLKEDEPAVLAEVARVRAEEYALTPATTRFDASGRLKAAPALPELDPRAADEYVARYTGAFAPGGLRGLRLAVYQHSAVGRDLLAKILAALGADVVPVGRSETFIPIDTENVTDEQLRRLEGLAREHGPVHAIVSTDGDSDRPLVTAVQGGHVRFLPGDLLGLVALEHLGARTAAVPISANDAVERRCAERGVELVTTRIGSPYVVAAMAAAKGPGVVGWEANGGFLLHDGLSLPHGRLGPLASRDAVLPILAALYAAQQKAEPLAAAWDRLPSRFGRAGLLDEVPVKTSQALVARLAPATGADVRFTGREDAAWREARTLLSRHFTSADGFGDIERINTLDGVRIWFSSGDVAHVRPSGNAPQLRLYANAGSQQRADAIVQLAIREPDGLLRRLLREVS